MRYWIIIVILWLTVMITASCNYHLRGTATQVATTIKNIVLDSYDPYGPLTRAVRTELRLNGITPTNNIQDKNNKLALLQIVNSSENQVTKSVFQNGKTAEYQIMLSVYMQVIMPNTNYYPFDVKVYKSFFDNPLMALAKNAEMDILRKEMYEQAAQKIVQKLLKLSSLEEFDILSKYRTRIPTVIIVFSVGFLMIEYLMKQRLVL